MSSGHLFVICLCDFIEHAHVQVVSIHRNILARNPFRGPSQIGGEGTPCSPRGAEKIVEGLHCHCVSAVVAELRSTSRAMAQNAEDGDDGNWQEPMAGATSVTSNAAGGTQQASTSIGPGEAGNGSQFRDKDPPPGYDGSQPELTFRQYEKSVRLWQFETDVPLRKQGAKLLRALSGSARLAVDDMEFEDIATEEGIKNILGRLREYYMPHLEVSLPRAFESAVYGQQRQPKETFADYVHRMERSFALLAKEGVDLPKGATGYIMYRQAALTESQDQRILTWCEGRYDRDAIVKALRRMDKVVKEKGSRSSNYVMDSEQVSENAQGGFPEEIYVESDDEFIYIAEGDLDGIYEEKDMLEALASYKEVRQALKEQKTSRGFFPGRGFGIGKGTSKGKGKTRIHKEQLKLRTRCWKCGQIGHISAECTNKVVIKEGTNPASSAGSSGKSSFFVSMADETAVESCHSGENTSAFWLRNFVDRRAQTRRELACEHEGAYKSAEFGGSSTSSTNFHGIVTRSFEGVVDTAAEGGLIGSMALRRLESELHELGLCCQWTPKTSSAKGVGGQANVIGVILIPIGIGNINGVLEATVVEGDVPLLLPIRLLKALGAVINIPEGHIVFEKHAVKVPMTELNSGHMVIRITDFANGRFETPVELQADYDFRHDQSEDLNHVVMLAQQRLSGGTTSPRSSTQSTNSLLRHGSDHGPGAEFGKTKGCTADSSQFEASNSSPHRQGHQKLADHAGQAVHHHGHGGVARRHWRLVPTILSAGVVALARDFSGGHLCGAHRGGEAAGSREDQGSSSSVFQCLRPSQSQVEGWWQREGFMDMVPGLQLPVGKSIPRAGVAQGSQGGEPRQETGLLGSKCGLSGHSRGDGSGDGYGRGSEWVRPSPAECGIPDLGSSRKYESTDGRADDESHGRDEAATDSHRSTGRASKASTSDPLERDAREDVEARGHDHGPAEPERRERPEELRTHDTGGMRNCIPCREFHSEGSSPGRQSNARTNVQVRGTGREVGSEERGTKTGKVVLEMHSTPVRFLPVGSGGGPEVDDGGVQGSPKCSGQPQPDRVMAAGDTSAGCGGPDVRKWPLDGTLKARKQARRLQLQKHSEFFHVEHQYQIFEGEWKDRSGLIPLDSTADIRVKLGLNDRTLLQQCFDDGKETQFNRRQRRTIQQGISCFPGAPNRTVAEVFSPPRVAEAAQRHGLQQGKSYDLVTGWDLSDPIQVKAMWRQLAVDKPLLIVLSPPCTAFSPLQEWNFPRMSLRNAVRLIVGGIEHLELSASIARWQHQQGRFFVFEHPDLAKSWKEDCIEQLAMLDGIYRITCDMCQYNLRADGQELNKKPTGLLLNSEEMAKHLQRRCRGGHSHKALLHGLAKKAQKYTPEFCRAIIQGLKRQIMRDGGVHRPEEIWAVDESWNLEEVETFEDPPSDEEEVCQVEGGEQEGSSQITEEEQRMVAKLHRNVGHPQRAEFIRFMRAARVRPEVVRWASKEFKCDVCESKSNPKPARPAAIPRSYQPNKVIGVDITFIPQVGGGGVIPILNILDWGTNYQMMEKLESKHPQEVWEVLRNVWFRIFGAPEVIVTDQGKEFSQAFQVEAAKVGILVHQTAARAPWQQGRTERHGAHFKDILEKARSEEVITSEQELVSLMREVEQAKNRYSNRSGFAPVQRQIGQWPRVPNSLLADDHLDVTLVDGMMVDDLERLHQMRRVAQKAFVEVNARTSMRKALHGRSRTWQNYEAGDLVYVYRVPRARKTKSGAKEMYELATNKATWVGPGTVIVPDGANLWIAMMGELWKVAREQCRKATSDEKQGVEMVMQECHDLIQEFKKSSKRSGYKDITEEAFPPMEDGKPIRANHRPKESGSMKRWRSWMVKSIPRELQFRHHEKKVTSRTSTNPRVS